MLEKGNNRTNHPQGGRLDPRIAAMLEQAEKQGVPSLETLTPIQAREFMNVAVRELREDPEAVEHVESLNIPGPAGQIPVRVYMPEGGGPFPVLVYFHGGGWVFCNLDTHDNVCRSLENGAGCVVVSVGYRLAPENKFPAAVEDTYSATQWVANNAARINADPTRIAVGGDSSGGNLAAVVSLMARNQNEPSLIYQLLVNPATNLSSFDTDSHRNYAEGYGQTGASIEWCRGHYLEKHDWRHPYASPLLAEDLSGLPPALVITSEFDVLRDEGEAYANRLQQAGVPVKCTRYNGMIHFGVMWAVASDLARDAIDEATAALRSAFATGVDTGGQR
jgi:acetyl esterase